MCDHCGREDKPTEAIESVKRDSRIDSGSVVEMKRTNFENMDKELGDALEYLSNNVDSLAAALRPVLLESNPVDTEQEDKKAAGSQLERMVDMVLDKIEYINKKINCLRERCVLDYK